MQFSSKKIVSRFLERLREIKSVEKFSCIVFETQLWISKKFWFYVNVIYTYTAPGVPSKSVKKAYWRYYYIGTWHRGLLIYLLHSPLPLSSFCTDLAVMSRARTYPPMASVAASGVALRHSLPITMPSSISWCNSSSPTGICGTHRIRRRSGHYITQFYSLDFSQCKKVRFQQTLLTVSWDLGA